MTNYPAKVDATTAPAAACPATAQPPLGSAPDFDEDAALARLNGDRDFLMTLATMFVEIGPSEVAEIGAAIDLQDARLLSRSAHKFKGSVQPFCAAAVIDRAQALESIGESGQLAAAPAEFRCFEMEVHRLLSALAALSPRVCQVAGPSSP